MRIDSRLRQLEGRIRRPRDKRLAAAQLAWELAWMNSTVPAGEPGSPERAAQLRALEAARVEYERLKNET